MSHMAANYYYYGCIVGWQTSKGFTSRPGSYLHTNKQVSNCRKPASIRLTGSTGRTGDLPRLSRSNCFLPSFIFNRRLRGHQTHCWRNWIWGFWVEVSSGICLLMKAALFGVELEGGWPLHVNTGPLVLLTWVFALFIYRSHQDWCIESNWEVKCLMLPHRSTGRFYNGPMPEVILLAQFSILLIIY